MTTQFDNRTVDTARTFQLDTNKAYDTNLNLLAFDPIKECSVSSREEAEPVSPSEKERLKDFAKQLNLLRTDKTKQSELKVYNSSDSSYYYISEESLESRKGKRS